jgi:hypothetical protein
MFAQERKRTHHPVYKVFSFRNGLTTITAPQNFIGFYKDAHASLLDLAYIE